MSRKLSITSTLITTLTMTTLCLTGTVHAADTLPFTVTLEEVTYTDNAPPNLQSFTSAVLEDGRWLIMAGRVVGLHTFNAVDNQADPSEGNFPPESANWKMYVIDPNEGVQASFDVSQLSDELSGPLRSTNQQFWHDEEHDTLYVTGGYGVDYADNLMVTFDTMLVMSPEKIASILTSGETDNAIAQALEAEIRVFHDNRFAVTGGYFENLGGLYYLAFGQLFFGQYSTFGRPQDSLFAQRQQNQILDRMESTGHDVAELRTATAGGVPFVQHYTEELRVFTLDPDDFNILSYGATVTSDPARSFHRRDGNFVKTVDPATGKARLAAFGGVFPPGVIGAYPQPIYIDGPGIYEIADFEQSFSQYECPILITYDPDAEAVYHTFFAGISNHFYHLTDKQLADYETVTAEGRNDGLPWINDISVLVLDSDGSHSEYILPESMPDHRLLGANAEILKAVSPSGATNIRYAAVPEAIDLSKMKPGESRVVAYIYGGIEATAPLPLIPNLGTSASSSVFAVTLTKTPTSVIPASKATFANPNPHFHRARGAMMSHGED
jgi:hypothetical protein